jgi:hypothetical protein
VWSERKSAFTQLNFSRFGSLSLSFDLEKKRKKKKTPTKPITYRCCPQLSFEEEENSQPASPLTNQTTHTIESWNAEVTGQEKCRLPADNHSQTNKKKSIQPEIHIFSFARITYMLAR